MTLSASQRLALAWVLVAALLVGLLWLLSPVLLPFLLAAVFAYVLHPLVEKGVSLKCPRTLAVLLAEGSLLLILVVLALLVVPVLAHEVPLLRNQVPAMMERLQAFASPWLAHWGLDWSLDIPRIKAFIFSHWSDNAEEWLGTLLSGARIGGSVLMTWLGYLILIPVVLFYLLQDWPLWVQRVRALVPPARLAAFEAITLEIDGILGQYFRGQVLVMGALAIYFSVVLSLLGLDLALPLGLFTGLAVAIPYLGFGLGLLLALLSAWLQFQGGTVWVWVLLAYGFGQWLESFVLTPRWVGERLGLNPLMVIFALLAFGHLLGFVGVLVALPLAALVVVGWRHLIHAYQGSALYRGSQEDASPAAPPDPANKEL